MLRGINVSGQKNIKINELKSLYEALGFQNVATYIQSGNVIFDTNLKDTGDLRIKIEQAIEDKYNFHVPLVLRSNLELKNIIENCPFDSIDLEEHGTKVLVTFLSSQPSEVKIAVIKKYVVAPEELVIRGKEAYLYCPNGYGKSKLSNTFIESKLGLVATTRNWKTVHKLYELSSK